MNWLTETTITLTPLSLGVIIFGGMALGWTVYALRGYKYWFKRFHHYKIPRKNKLRKNYGYVEYVPEVANLNPRTLPSEAPLYRHQPLAGAYPPIQGITPTPLYSKKDDLRVIEGIGPRIEKILNSQGIYTWHELAMTSIAHLEKILATAGKKFQMHNPSLWPKQAQMADQGLWNELRKWQESLDGGSEEKKV
jgi:hypothetical protein